jgi:hypothetical protein
MIHTASLPLGVRQRRFQKNRFPEGKALQQRRAAALLQKNLSDQAQIMLPFSRRESPSTAPHSGVTPKTMSTVS